MDDVLIVGGGVIGLSSAWALARCGVKVRVVDQSAAGTESSWAGAGMLPPINLDHVGPWSDSQRLTERLRMASNEIWPAWNLKLRDVSGLDTSYRVCGSLELEIHAEEWRQAGIAFEVLQQQALQTRFPWIAPSIERAAFVPQFAQVRNPWHLRCLLSACRQAGVNITENVEVASWQCDRDRIRAVVTKQGDVLPAGSFVLAAGAWSGALLPESSKRVEIAPVRGQIVLLKTSEVLLVPVIEAGLRYLVPRDDGHILVGSTEESVGFDKRTTAVAIRDLIDFACSIVPELAQASIVRTWAGFRPFSSLQVPLIGQHPQQDNLYLATGHYRNGLQLSVVTAEIIAGLISGVGHHLAAPCRIPLDTAFAYSSDRPYRDAK